MTKFPVLRDLVRRSRPHVPLAGEAEGVDRRRRLRRPRPRPARVAGRPVDSLPAVRVHDVRLLRRGLPAVLKVELVKRSDETDAEFTARQNRAYDEAFVGAATISQAILFNEHPTGHLNAGERLDALMAPGGTARSAATPKTASPSAPRTSRSPRSIARAGRQTTVRMLTRWFDS